MFSCRQDYGVSIEFAMQFSGELTPPTALSSNEMPMHASVWHHEHRLIAEERYCLDQNEDFVCRVF
jgi:hypothetical protein